MKVFGVLLCLLVSVNALAQSDSTSHKDTSKKFIIIDEKPVNHHEKVLYVIDGKSYYKESVKKYLDIKNILYVEVIKPNEALIKYGKNGAKGAIIINSKKFAISSYQAMLGSFSKDYQIYLKSNQNKDDDFEYVLNGSPMRNSYYDNIEKLYKIPSKSIKRVDFLENPSHNGYSNKTKIVNILTGD